jgi:hypothetical protein
MESAGISGGEETGRQKRTFIRFMSRHFVAYGFEYESLNADGSVFHHGIGVHSGFLLELAGQWFWVTAGHCLQEDLEEPLAKGQIRLAAGNFMDYFGDEATNNVSVPYLYEAGCAMYLEEPALGLDFGLIPIDGLMRQTFLANKNVPICRENWIHQHRLEFEGYYLLGIPRTKVFKKPTSYGVEINMQPQMIAVRAIDPGTVEGASSTEWFAGQNDEDAEIETVEGMSGGPIYGLRRHEKGRLLYHAVAVQSRWIRSKRIIFGCPLPNFAEQVLRLLIQSRSGLDSDSDRLTRPFT